MQNVLRCILLGSFLSCSDKGNDSVSSETDADTDADSDTDTDTDVGCEPLAEGRWVMDGTQFGSTHEADVTMDAKACAFVFSNWNMSMSEPDGGTIDGTTIQLTGPSPWNTCTGVEKSPTEASGTCDGGGSWTMQLP